MRADPLGFEPYAITLILLQAAASLGFFMLLRSLFGARLGILAPLALYLFSSITLNSFIWWAAGVNQLALQVAIGWGLFAHVAYLRTGRLRWVLVTALVIVGCLTFYEKVLLTYGAIAIITLAYFTTGSIRHRVQQIWSHHRVALVVHVACGAAYLVVYARFALSLPETQGGGSPTPS